VDTGWFGSCAARLPPFGRDEVGDGDWLVAVGAGPAGADSATEALAVRTALLTEQACPTGRALIDDGDDGDRSWRHEWWEPWPR
jgi:hypothetical protein